MQSTLNANRVYVDWHVSKSCRELVVGFVERVKALPGNHDFDTVAGGPNCATTRDNYDANFGPGEFPAPGPGSFYGGNQFDSDGDPTNDTNDNNYTLFNSPGGVEFIAINLGWSDSGAAAALWADGLLKSNPNRLGIVTSHSILSDSRTGGADCESTDPYTEQGRIIWDEVKDNPNLIMMLGGHCRGERWITYDGGTAERPGCLGDVHVLMSNYQFYPPGNSSGYMRIMRFDTAAWTLDVDTISEEPVPASTTAFIPGDMDDDTVSNFSLDYNAFVGQCVDVALSMDRSGSMNAQFAAIAPASKLDAVQSAAKMFVDQIALDDNHRLVMKQWNSTIVPWTTPDTTFDALNPVDDTSAGIARDMADSMSGGGATNITGGLEAAVDELDVGGPNDRRVVVLFTDGQHNTPPVANNAALIADLEFEINDVDNAMELYSIGFGTSINNGPLSTVTGTNDGWHITEVDPLIVGKTFSVVAAHVMGDQTLSDPVFVLKPGETRSHRFGVSRSDTNITISANWDLFDPNRIRTKVVPPGGGSCSISSGATVPRTQQTSGTNYRLIRVNLPFPCGGADVHEGDVGSASQVDIDPRDSRHAAGGLRDLSGRNATKGSVIAVRIHWFVCFAVSEPSDQARQITE